MADRRSVRQHRSDAVPRSAGRQALRRHEAEARSVLLADSRPGSPDPRRADDRGRPAGAPAVLGAHRPHPRPAADDERAGRDRLHGRGGTLRLAGGDERRQGARDRNARGDQAARQRDDARKAFIKLLPEEARRGHKEPVIPPWKSSGGTPAIEAEGLTQRFGAFTAVDHVNFRIERGEIFGFLGSNGCGKTTTMKMLTGLLPPTEGTALLFGKPVKGGDVESRRHVGFMTQAFSLYTELTVRQNMMLHARLFDLPDEKAHERVEELLKTFAWSRSPTPWPKSLPLGIRQRLSLAVAVIHEPEMLILDEPTSGVDPVARDGFWELLIRLSRENGVTIFLSTHFMNEAERCDRMSMMHAGKVLAQGPPAQLVAERKAKNSRRGLHRLPRGGGRRRRGGTGAGRPAGPGPGRRRPGAAADARRRAARAASASAASGHSRAARRSSCSTTGTAGVLRARAHPLDDRVRLRHLARRRSFAVCGAGHRRDAGQPPLRGHFPRFLSTSRRDRRYSTTRSSTGACATASCASRWRFRRDSRTTCSAVVSRR